MLLILMVEQHTAQPFLSVEGREDGGVSGGFGGRVSSD